MPIRNRPIKTVSGKLRAGRNLGLSAALAAEDSLALAKLAPLNGSALPWTSFSMRPAAISTIVTEIIVGRRRRILECGSGNSTIYIARLFEQLGSGKILSIDHDSDWAAATRSMLVEEALTTATVLHRPLAAGWYGITDDDLTDQYDMLIVDGPPGHETDLQFARLPALPRLVRHLTPDVTVALDDVNRTGERQIVDRWSREYRLSFDRQPGGIAIGRRHP